MNEQHIANRIDEIRSQWEHGHTEIASRMVNALQDDLVRDIEAKAEAEDTIRALRRQAADLKVIDDLGLSPTALKELAERERERDKLQEHVGRLVIEKRQLEDAHGDLKQHARSLERCIEDYGKRSRSDDAKIAALQAEVQTLKSEVFAEREKARLARSSGYVSEPRVTIGQGQVLDGPLEAIVNNVPAMVAALAPCRIGGIHLDVPAGSVITVALPKE